MSNYFIYYSESNLVCLIIFAIMLINDYINVDRQEKQIKYDRSLIAFMLYFASDVFWAGIISGVLPRTRFTVVTANFANYVFMAALTYFWLQYVMAVEQVPNRDIPTFRFAIVSPFLVSTALLIGTYLFAPHVLLSESLELRPLYHVFQLTVPIINIIAMLFYTIRRAVREENRQEKRRHLFIGFFPLMVIVGGLFQVLFLPETPIFCFACTILMLVFYIHSLNAQISLDPLTKLNNRGQLLHYLSQKSNVFMEGRGTYVIMIDINDFKSINDTFGHAEGDHVLVLVSNSLKKVLRRHNMPVFLGRYGGDEFILITHPLTEDELDPMIREIRDEVSSACETRNAPYRVTLSIGYDELMRVNDSIQKCLQRADYKQYLDKANAKAGSIA